MSDKISITELKDRIRLLENQRATELADLKSHFHHVYESLRPINLIKNTLKTASESSEIKDGLLDSAIGVSTGLLSQKLFMGTSANPIRRVVGGLIRFGITRFVTQHTSPIKAVGQAILLKVLNRRAEKKNQKINS